MVSGTQASVVDAAGRDQKDLTLFKDGGRAAARPRVRKGHTIDGSSKSHVKPCRKLSNHVALIGRALHCRQVHSQIARQLR